jgi:hypothetical protein
MLKNKIAGVTAWSKKYGGYDHVVKKQDGGHRRVVKKQDGGYHHVVKARLRLSPCV